jgi:hypothetical protein
VGEVLVDYVIRASGIGSLREDMIAMGNVGDIRWLVSRLEALSAEDILDSFNDWKIGGPEGKWGSIQVGPYVIQCQLEIPPRRQRALGAPLLLKVDAVGDQARILERLRELERGNPKP